MKNKKRHRHKWTGWHPFGDGSPTYFRHCLCGKTQNRVRKIDEEMVKLKGDGFRFSKIERRRAVILFQVRYEEAQRRAKAAAKELKVAKRSLEYVKKGRKN